MSTRQMNNMISFESDYITGCHNKILEKLAETNLEELSGYGVDKYSNSAKEKIKKLCEKDVEVEFLVGGTQTNAIVIAGLLKDYEGVIAASTGHINAHEAGAIEYTNHKVLSIPNHQGKIDVKELKEYVDAFYNDGNHEHMVFPGMVYISLPTEYGTIYSKCELESIYKVCKEYNISLYIDGARLGYALMSKECDYTLSDLCNMCDVFYIGGTKVGALCGEAIVFTNNNKPTHFVNFIKKRGALVAKGRLLGIQFDCLFTDNLYFEIGKHAINMANELKKVLKEKNCKFFLETPTNQQFIILENNKLKEIEKEVKFSFWEKYDDNHTVVRLATTWSTTKENIDKLKEIL